MGEEGSKAMTVYIVACFLLAMGALVGYKFVNDERETLSTDYVQLAVQFADIQAAFAPNINSYYSKVKAGLIKPPDKEARDNTHVRLGEIANKLGIREGTGAEDHLDVGTPVSKVAHKSYREYTLVVELKNVTQTEWAVFLSQAQHETREYAFVQTIRCNRAERRFARLDVSKTRDDDKALWNVTITFVWFGPLNEA
jgi:hypothetical protein